MLLAMLAVFLVSSLVTGMGNFRTFEADCTIEVIGEPKLNEPFEVVFTFTPRGEFLHTKGFPDTAYIRHTSEHVEHISGDTMWIGELHNGTSNELRAWFKLTQKASTVFSGVIWAVQAKGHYKTPRPDEDFGLRAFSLSRSDVIDLRESTVPYIVLNRYEIDSVDSLPVIIGVDTVYMSSISKPIIPDVKSESPVDSFETE